MAQPRAAPKAECVSSRYPIPSGRHEPEYDSEYMRRRRARTHVFGWGRLAALLALAGVVFVVTGFITGRGQFAGITIFSDPGRARAAQLKAAGITAPDDKVIHDLDKLHKVFGEPPDAKTGRMYIPSTGVDAPIGQRHVGKDGVMANPTGPDDVILYGFSEWPGLGGWPGAGGNAVFAGHADRAAHLDYANVDYLGPGVFFRLDQVKFGDTIRLDIEGKSLKYKVISSKEVAADSSDWNSVFTADPKMGDMITIVTCGGDFNRTDHAYTKRLVVRAVRA